MSLDKPEANAFVEQYVHLPVHEPSGTQSQLQPKYPPILTTLTQPSFMSNSIGAKWHLLYPFVIWILVAVCTWSPASSIWLSAVKSMDQEVRFGPKDYCRYNVTVTNSVRHLDDLGCISAGWSYQVDVLSLDLDIPGSISTSLSKAAILLVICRFPAGRALIKMNFLLTIHHVQPSLWF
jgi:hypothetical protein